MRVKENLSRSYAIAAVVLGSFACDQQSRQPNDATDAVTSGRWIDVTATLDPATTPVYEGDAPMSFEFLKDMRKGDGFTLSKLSLGAHSGTHVDAPMHFIRDGASIEKLPLEPFIGRARVIDIPDSVQSIDAAELNRHQWRNAKRVVFRTRSSVRGWMRSSTFHRDFAYLAKFADRKIEQPALFISGAQDMTLRMFGRDVEPRMREVVTDLRGYHLIDRCGHWTQQEKPAEVNRLLLGWLKTL